MVFREVVFEQISFFLALGQFVKCLNDVALWKIWVWVILTFLLDPFECVACIGIQNFF